MTGGDIELCVRQAKEPYPDPAKPDGNICHEVLTRIRKLIRYGLDRASG
jgi:hypothetical protein